jgi:hypothetical protein
LANALEPEPSMKHDSTIALHAYWNTLRGNRLAPHRSELDPRAIAPLLESTFILEHNRASTPRFRLAGTKLCDQFGMELRGMSALALWHGDGRAQIRKLLNGVIDRPAVGHVACTVETRRGYLFEAEFLFLPLYNDLGVLNRILGCGYYLGARDMAAVGYEPMHHWVDATSLSPVSETTQTIDDAPRLEAQSRESCKTDAESPGMSERNTPIFGEKRLGEKTSIGSLADRAGQVPSRSTSKAAQIGAPGMKRAPKKKRPLLYTIDGGLRDQNAVSRLKSEAERRQASPGDAKRAAHLRIVISDNEQRGG